MFHRARDASKVALVHLIARLKAGGFRLLDTQFVTDHLKSFGAVEVPRRQYHKLLEAALGSDADFGAPLFGTNLKGYTLRGNLALSKNVWLGVWWMSADNIIGPQFKSDVLQVDINGKF